MLITLNNFGECNNIFVHLVLKWKLAKFLELNYIFLYNFCNVLKTKKQVEIEFRIKTYY